MLTPQDREDREIFDEDVKLVRNNLNGWLRTGGLAPCGAAGDGAPGARRPGLDNVFW